MKSLLIRQNSFKFPEKGIVWIEELKKFRGERERRRTRRLCKLDSLPSIRHVISHRPLILHYHLQKHSSTCQENTILLQSFSQLLSDRILHDQKFEIGKWSMNVWNLHTSTSFNIRNVNHSWLEEVNRKIWRINNLWLHLWKNVGVDSWLGF